LSEAKNNKKDAKKSKNSLKSKAFISKRLKNRKELMTKSKNHAKED